MPWAGLNKTQGAQGDTCRIREADKGGGDGQSDNRTTVIQTRWSQRNASQKMLEATPEADGTTSEATEPPEREKPESGRSSRSPLARMATDSMTPNHVSQDMRETRQVSDTPNLSPEQSQPAPLPAARAPRAGVCLGACPCLWAWRRASACLAFCRASQQHAQSNLPLLKHAASSSQRPFAL